MKSIYRKKSEWSMRNVMILAVVLIILMPVLTVFISIPYLMRYINNFAADRHLKNCRTLILSSLSNVNR